MRLTARELVHEAAVGVIAAGLLSPYIRALAVALGS